MSNARPSRPSLAILATLAHLASFGCAGEHGSDRAGPPSDDRVAPADCGVPAGDVQIDEGIGVLRPGTSIEDVRRRCTVVRDTVVPGPEGMSARLLVVQLGADSAVGEVVDETIWRVRLSSGRFRSAQGFGVGTRAREIAAAPGAGVHVGEGEVYMRLEGICGESYRLAGVDVGRVASAQSAERALEGLPDSARVDRVLLRRCPQDRGA
ncbi:MAG TPA: hypothetical protein VK922_11805 [Gemmatimonadaceae bacterium]|nr:hypothetical protein [Gemmatimonadaceae bacterium]